MENLKTLQRWLDLPPCYKSRFDILYYRVARLFTLAMKSRQLFNRWPIQLWRVPSGPDVGLCLMGLLVSLSNSVHNDHFESLRNLGTPLETKSCGFLPSYFRYSTNNIWTRIPTVVKHIPTRGRNGWSYGLCWMLENAPRGPPLIACYPTYI